MTITTLIDARQVQEALLEVRPTWFFGVPRIYEKIEVAMLEHVRDDATRAALDAAVERVRNGEPWVDDPLLAPLREATGPRARRAGPGSPARRARARWPSASTPSGIPLSEAWGMSETVIGTGAAPGQDPDRRRRLALLGHRDPARRRRRDPAAQPVGHARLPEGPGAHRRGVHRGRLHQDRRPRALRRGRLPVGRRAQEGHHHQLGRQEHVAGQHRAGDPRHRRGDRAGRVLRRRPALQRRADRARPAAGRRARGRGPAAGRAGPSSGRGRARRARGRGGQRAPLARGAAQALRDLRGRVDRPAATSSRSPASSSGRTSTPSTPSSSTTFT